MKNLFNYLPFILFSITSFSFNAQSQSAAVLSVYTQSAKISPEMAESVLRVEMTKTEQFNVIDKLDMIEILEENEIDLTNCYGKKCLLKVGKSAGVDKVVTGSVENLGKKIVVTVKILDVASESYDKVAIEEFINLDSEIQSMVKIVVNKALGIENNQEILNTLVYFNQPAITPTTYLKNNGPRMGLSYVIGNTAKILSAPKSDGGLGIGSQIGDSWNPVVMSQIGYQFEGSYLSAGDFQALLEGLIFITGVEKGLFSPSLALLNGFRSSKNGWEFGFGPTFRISSTAEGFYTVDSTGNGDYDVINDWNYRADGGWAAGETPVFEHRTDFSRNSSPRIKTGWVWALGRTFHSGYLNIPINLFYSSGSEGGYLGLSMGFNIAKKD
jgi:TolB-like protein